MMSIVGKVRGPRPAELRLGVAAFVIGLATPSAHAQNTRVQELERSVRERDQVITELLERVEALERRVGVPHRATDKAKARGVPPGAKRELAQRAEAKPGAVVVDEAAAERALERSLTREGALLLPAGVVEIEPALSYLRREEAVPSLVSSEGALFAGETRRKTDGVTADLAMRIGLPWDSQLEIGVPYRWRHVESVNRVGFTPTSASTVSGSGLGDVRVGVAKTLLREGLWRPDLVGRVVWDTDSGKRQENGVGLGGGFKELRASLTAIKRQDPLAFVGGLGYEHAFENGQISPGRTISANFGGFVALSPETSLRLQLLAARQQETEFLGRKIPGSRQTVATFVVGGSILLGRGTLLNLSAGIGLTEDADDFSIMISLPMRFFGM
jgi:hypothetical protein